MSDSHERRFADDGERKSAITLRIIASLAAAGFFTLVVAVGLSPSQPIYDEQMFVPNLHLFDDLGLTAEFLTEMDNQAPGPLYQVVHATFRSLTGYRFPATRYVNVLCLALLAAITWRTARNTQVPTPALVAWNYLAIPTVITISGMALTEMPAMLFMGASLLFLSVVYRSEQIPGWQHVACSLASGLCLGAAVLGRSPFLVVLLALPLLLYRHPRVTRIWVAISLVGVAVACVVAPVFLVWGGLIPPKVQMPSGLAFGHAALSFAYAGLTAAIVAPGWFLPVRLLLPATPLCFVVAFVANFYWWGIETAPLSHFMSRALPAAVFGLYAPTATALILTLGLLFLVSAAYRCWEKREDSWYGFLLVSMVAVIGASLAVTHTFSSRYVGQAAPLMVLALAPYDRPAWFKPILYVGGMTLGFASLYSYYSC